MTRLSMATASVSGDLRRKLETIAAAGFTGVDLHEPDLTGFSGTTKDINSHAASLGLSIEVFQTAYEFVDLTGPDLAAYPTRLDQKIQLMQELGCTTLLVGATLDKPAVDDQGACIAALSQLAERVSKAGCRAALLALPWSRQAAREVDLASLIQHVDSPHLGLALNSVFSLVDGSQAARLRDIPGDQIFHVQLSDAPKQGLDVVQHKRDIGLLPGQGGLNLGSFVRVLARAGYDGVWSLPHNGATATDSQDTYAHDGYRALVSLLDDVSQTEPRLAQPLRDLPRRVHATGFEFIEFAVSDQAYTELTAVLAAMSFRMERRHRSKTVELWRQGAVNIVVNSETIGHAATVRAGNGPCVCDMGLRVKDAAQTAQRALMLGAPAFSQSVGVGELDIPAVKGVGGSIVHFIDEQSNLHRVWDIEFDPVPRKNVPPPAGLRRIDHVAQTMRYQEMQSWLTYYLTTFEMEKADIVDVVDPSGLILSQALSSPEGEVRLNLNGAGEQRTFAGTFLSKGFGAGVQHMAFATDDIFETSDLLHAVGFSRLDIAANYYEDLQVRFDLTEDFVAKLRAGNILYDRYGRGEYFQIYSTALWGGFFFEIVERRNGYDGYGARNAPIRLAAQMQHTKALENT